MGELYLGLPQSEENPKVSLKNQIAMREQKLSGRYDDQRHRIKELALVQRANL
jgi:hypothetical protein